MKKILCCLLLMMSMLLVACKKEEAEKTFLEILTEAKSYKVEGVMESFYQEGRKQNNFTVYFKDPLLKVVTSSTEDENKQIILKNNDGVYILIPSVNKNFKIQSGWPNNASYPYLLQSLAKDIANEENPIITEDETTKTIETETFMHKNAVATKQKIILDKETCLPTEVLIYDAHGDLFIRVVFTNVELDYNVSDDEFIVEKSMTTARTDATTSVEYQREVDYPTYFPTGCILTGETTASSTDGTEVRSIMKYSGDVGFTLIQEFVYDQETTVYQQEVGEVVFVLGTAAILKDGGVHTIYQGVEYTVASNNLSIDEMIKIVSSYMMNETK